MGTTLRETPGAAPLGVAVYLPQPRAGSLDDEKACYNRCVGEVKVSNEAATGSTPETRLQAYAGEWVVLENGTVIEHGTDLVELVKRARARGIEKPYVHFVEPIEAGVVRIGL